MATNTVAPVIGRQFFDNNGLPLNGGVISFFQAGTSTPQVVYQDVLLTVPWGTSITLNSSGRVGGQIYPPTSPAIKYIIKDSLGNTIESDDNVIANAGAS